MKNQFSKALIYGVIASSVILVNCQKSPNRSVTPNKSGGSAKTDATGTNADVTNVCVNEILDAHKATQVVATKINDIIVDKSSSEKTTLKEKSKLTAGDQSSIKDLTTELTAKHEAVLAAFKKAKVDSCLSEASKDKQRSAAPVLSTAGETQFYNALVENVNKLLGEVVAETKPVPKITTTTAVASSDDLVQSHFNLDSANMGEALSKLTKESGQFFMDGKVVQDDLARDEFSKDDSKSGCGVITAATEAPEKDALITVMSVEAGTKKGERNSYKVTATATGTATSNGDLTFTLSCLIAAKKDLVSEFKSVFKGLMTFQTAEQFAKNQEELKDQAKKIVDDQIEKKLQEQQPASDTKAAETEGNSNATSTPTAADAKAGPTEVKVDSTIPAVDSNLAGSPQKQTQDAKSAEAQPTEAKNTQEAKVEKKADAKVQIKAVDKPEATAAEKTGAAIAKAFSDADAKELAKLNAEIAALHESLVKSAAEAKEDYNSLTSLSKTYMAIGKESAKRRFALSNQVVLDGNALFGALVAERNARASKSSAAVIDEAHKKVMTAKAVKEKTDKALEAFKTSDENARQIPVMQ